MDGKEEWFLCISYQIDFIVIDLIYGCIRAMYICIFMRLSFKFQYFEKYNSIAITPDAVQGSLGPSSVIDPS